MRINHILLICLMNVGIYPAFAQSVEDIKNDKNIIWAVEDELDYLFLDLALESTHEYYYTPEKFEIDINLNGQKIKTLKSTVKSHKLSYDMTQDHMLHNMIDEYIYSEGTKIYKTSDLTSIYNKEELRELLYTHDTIITFDPNTFEEIVQVVTNKNDPEDMKFYTVKNHIYYDEQKIEFCLVPQAIGIKEAIYNDNGELTKHRVELWFPVDVVKEPLDYASMPNITWAKRTYQNYYMGGGKDGARQIKGEKEMYEMNEKMFQDLAKNAKKIHLGNIMDRDGMGVPYKTKEIKSNMKSYEWHTDIAMMQFVQDWYWDANKQRLLVRYVGCAPMNEGEDPFFIRRHDRLTP